MSTPFLLTVREFPTSSSACANMLQNDGGSIQEGICALGSTTTTNISQLLACRLQKGWRRHIGRRLGAGPQNRAVASGGAQPAGEQTAPCSYSQWGCPRPTRNFDGQIMVHTVVCAARSWQMSILGEIVGPSGLKMYLTAPLFHRCRGSSCRPPRASRQWQWAATSTSTPIATPTASCASAPRT